MIQRRDRLTAAGRVQAALALVLVIALLAACGGQQQLAGSSSGLAAPRDLDESGSDPRAIEIADATINAMGGEQAWARTRFVAWNFFGRRHLLWDRHSGTVRVETPVPGTDDIAVIVTSVQGPDGDVWLGGQPVTDATRRAEILERGYEAWVNDSYWLVMPYKLKDDGVVLRHLGTMPMADGRDAEALELTFRGVGLTPENKYRVYVAADSGLVEQWDFYGTADQPEPTLSTPWHDWKRYGEILLSGSRGERRLTDIEVLDSVPEDRFRSPEPIYLAP